jgi:MFS family permease
LALAVAGFVFGPVIAVGLMRLSGDDFRLVFWVALIPAYVSIIVLLFAVKEVPLNHGATEPQAPAPGGGFTTLPPLFWWAIAIASLLSLARFSPAFLVLKAHGTGVDASLVPLILGLMYFVYSTTSYPFGVLADRGDRRLQLGIGIIVLVVADVVLANAGSMWLAAIGAALWGLQMGATQGALATTIADAAPSHLRGTAFGILDVATGIATFAASAGAGALWMAGGSAMAFGLSACVAAAAGLMLLFQPRPNARNARS